MNSKACIKVQEKKRESSLLPNQHDLTQMQRARDSENI